MTGKYHYPEITLAPRSRTLREELDSLLTDNIHPGSELEDLEKVSEEVEKAIQAHKERILRVPWEDVSVRPSSESGKFNASFLGFHPTNGVFLEISGSRPFSSIEEALGDIASVLKSHDLYLP